MCQRYKPCKNGGNQVSVKALKGSNGAALRRQKKEPLDILAQLVTKDNPKEGKKYSDCQAKYQKRAQAKAITNEMAFRLLQVPETRLRNSYIRTFTCSEYLYQEGLKVTSRYCNNRWCLICNRIRTAKLMHGYTPAIEKMQEPMFVTLTIKAVQAHQLKPSIQSMYDTFSRITSRLRARDRRNNTGIVLNGIRKFECNYKPSKKTFNPHFHIVCDGKNVARVLVKEWLKDNPTSRRKAQDIRPASVDVVQELFKYFSKVITRERFDASGINAIFEAVKGRRTYQNYGLVQKVNEDVDDVKSERIDFKERMFEVWRWEKEMYDWLTADGDTFSGYRPNDRDKLIMKTLSTRDDAE